MFKELKKKVFQKVKEAMKTMLHQTENTKRHRNY